MNALELKKDIIEKIRSIHDTDLLQTIQTIVSTNSKSNYVELDNDLLNDLVLAKEEANQGHFISQKELDEKLEVWLSDK